MNLIVTTIPNHFTDAEQNDRGQWCKYRGYSIGYMKGYGYDYVSTVYLNGKEQIRFKHPNMHQTEFMAIDWIDEQFNAPSK